MWERSVRATHHFLVERDIQLYRAILEGFDFSGFQMYCLLREDGPLIGFVGTQGPKLEMLFLDPDYFGRGYGRKMMDFALTVLGIHQVDVNEGNLAARRFYELYGFRQVNRRPLDDFGQPYPILELVK